AMAFAAAKSALLEVKEGDGEVTLSGKAFSLRVDKKEGVIEQYRYKGVTLLERGPRPDFWRAPTNNDRGAWKRIRQQGGPEKSNDIELWRDAGPRWDVKNVQVQKVDDSAARVTVESELPAVGAKYTMTYTVHGTGDVIVECAYKPGTESL